MHRFENESFEDEHIQGALDEVIGLFGHARIPPDGQEES
jgi:hypothetical protein